MAGNTHAAAVHRLAGSPETPEGRLLCFFLAIYSFTMFGYITAILASYFIGQDAARDEAEMTGTALLQKEMDSLTAELAVLRAELKK